MEHGIPSGNDLNLGEGHGGGLAWRSQRLHLDKRDRCPSRRSRKSGFQSRVVPAGRHPPIDRRFGRVQLVWANVDELVGLSLDYQPRRKQREAVFAGRHRSMNAVRNVIER